MFSDKVQMIGYMKMRGWFLVQQIYKIKLPEI